MESGLWWWRRRLMSPLKKNVGDSAKIGRRRGGGGNVEMHDQTMMEWEGVVIQKTTFMHSHRWMQALSFISLKQKITQNKNWRQKQVTWIKNTMRIRRRANILDNKIYIENKQSEHENKWHRKYNINKTLQNIINSETSADLEEGKSETTCFQRGGPLSMLIVWKASTKSFHSLNLQTFGCIRTLMYALTKINCDTINYRLQAKLQTSLLFLPWAPDFFEPLWTLWFCRTINHSLSLGLGVMSNQIQTTRLLTPPPHPPSQRAGAKQRVNREPRIKDSII